MALATQWVLCEESGILAENGACPDHGGDACLVVFVPKPAKETELQRENRMLRGLVQTNPEWSCPHGANPRKSMALCPLGSACACAADRLAALLPEAQQPLIETLREALAKAQAYAEEYRLHVRAHIRAGALDHIPEDEVRKLGPTLESCQCAACQRIRRASASSIDFGDTAVRLLAEKVRKGERRRE